MSACPRRAAARTCRPGAARRSRARPRRAWRGRGGAFPGCGRCRAPARRRGEQFDHPAGAGADVDQAAERGLAERAATRRLDLALGDVERAQRVPIGGVAGEIAGRGGGAVGAHRGEPGGVGLGPGIGAVDLRPAVDQLEQGLDPRPRAEAEEHPAPLLAALGEAGVDQDADVARDARLALPEHLRELADARAPWRAAASGCEAGSDPPGPRRFGRQSHICGYKDIFISVKLTRTGRDLRTRDCQPSGREMLNSSPAWLNIVLCWEA